MNNNKSSSLGELKILGCIIFDIAIIIAFLKAFSLFFIIAAGKSMLILFILLVGLIILNGAVIFPDMVYKRLGIPYSAAIAILMVLYVIISNMFSILLIPYSIVWYIVWELIIFATFIIILSIITVFSKGELEDVLKAEKEQTDKTLINLQLMEIEHALIEKKEQEGILSLINIFNVLTERIKASTPFGRIVNNYSVLEVENRIKNNLLSFQLGIQEGSEHRDLLQMKKLLEDTQSLVINRETLNIK